jgi:hypothetical protein
VDLAAPWPGAGRHHRPARSDRRRLLGHQLVADQASASNSALLRVDIKRRDPLTGTVPSPLTTVLGGIIPRRKQDTAQLPPALDLPDIDPAEVTEVTRPARNGGPAPWPQQRPSKGATLTPDAPPAGEDISDWI